MRKCCVLIPYYNDGCSLLRSISSIDKFDLNYAPDVIVVDDGSEKVPAREVLKYGDFENQVELLALDSNQGIEHALNHGLKYCKDRYEYIARLDCGDICKNGRIGKQVKHLDEDPCCVVVGSWVDFVLPGGRYSYTLKHPTSHEAIKKTMHVNCALTHPSVILRSEILSDIGMYPVNYPAAEDFAFFFKILKKYKVANIPEILVDCELNPDGVSSAKRRIQIHSRIKILLENFEFSFSAVKGIATALILLFTPRKFTVFIKSALSSLKSDIR